MVNNYSVRGYLWRSDPVLVSAADPRVTGLEPDTDYTCSIVAINDEGRAREHFHCYHRFARWPAGVVALSSYAAVVTRGGRIPLPVSGKLVKMKILSPW